MRVIPLVSKDTGLLDLGFCSAIFLCQTWYFFAKSPISVAINTLAVEMPISIRPPPSMGKPLSCSIPSVPPLTRVLIRLTSGILPDLKAFGLGTFLPCVFFAVFNFPWLADLFVLCAVAGLQPPLR
jgi:hypothetical protein